MCSVVDNGSCRWMDGRGDWSHPGRHPRGGSRCPPDQVTAGRQQHGGGGRGLRVGNRTPHIPARTPWGLPWTWPLYGAPERWLQHCSSSSVGQDLGSRRPLLQCTVFTKRDRVFGTKISLPPFSTQQRPRPWRAQVMGRFCHQCTNEQICLQLEQRSFLKTTFFPFLHHSHPPRPPLRSATHKPTLLLNPLHDPLCSWETSQARGPGALNAGREGGMGPVC